MLVEMHSGSSVQKKKTKSPFSLNEADLDLLAFTCACRALLHRLYVQEQEDLKASMFGR